MKNNQSFHLSIKQPPNPEPIKSLGVFTDPDDPLFKQTIDILLNSPFKPKSKEFTNNVRDEVMKLLTKERIIGVARHGKLTAIYLEQP